MYKRQQQNGVIIPPILKEQLNIPIVKLVIELRSGKTVKVAIKTQEGFFLSAANGGGGFLFANATSIGPNETFLLIPQGLNREKIAIRTINKYYISSVGGGGSRVDATSTTIGPNEQFTLVTIRPDKANIITNQSFFLLAIEVEPKFVTAYGLASGPRTTFTIIPQV